MLELAQLQEFTAAAAAELACERDLRQFEVFCSSGQQIVARLNYTSDLPSRGVEELKSASGEGIALRIVIDGEPPLVGSGFAVGIPSLSTMSEALERARRSTIPDRHLIGLPSPGTNSRGVPLNDDRLFSVDVETIGRAAWTMLRGAIEAFAREPIADSMNQAQPDDLGIIIGGDLTVTRERVCVAGSSFPGPRLDQHARFVVSLTAMVESLEAKGWSSALGKSLVQLQGAVGSIGPEVVRKALAMRNGARPPGGIGKVVLGPQPIAEILHYVVLPSLTTGAFNAASSAYLGRFGNKVMDARLSLIDNPRLRNGAIHRRISSEGFSARPIEIIKQGRLAALLSNHDHACRLTADEQRHEKLGVSREISLKTTSGYRLGNEGRQRFDVEPNIGATNVVMRTRDGGTLEDLLSTVGDGVYIGNIWYTNPINDLRAGDFASTISCESYLIRNGKLAEPIAPNWLRIDGSIHQVFEQAMAVSRDCFPTTVWGCPLAYYVPSIAADGLRLSPAEGGACHSVTRKHAAMPAFRGHHRRRPLHL